MNKSLHEVLQTKTQTNTEGGTHTTSTVGHHENIKEVWELKAAARWRACICLQKQH